MFNYMIVWRTNNVIYDNDPRVHLYPKWQRNLSFPWTSQSHTIPHKQFLAILIHMQRLDFGDIHITNSAQIWCTFLRSVSSTDIQPNVTCSRSGCYCYNLKQKFHFPVCCHCRPKEMFLDQVICFCCIRMMCFTQNLQSLALVRRLVQLPRLLLP